MTIALSVFFLPFVLTRVDDGNRGARLIEGNGVTLIWAPEGPGWNSKHPWGGYPSWDMIALYGVSPAGSGDKPGYEGRHATAKDMETTGLCRYLSEDGTTLMTEPQDIWRMPTTDEIVRSLVRGGENAGCTLRQAQGEAWDGESGNADCSRQPNKDTPLWAPDAEPSTTGQPTNTTRRTPGTSLTPVGVGTAGSSVEELGKPAPRLPLRA